MQILRVAFASTPDQLDDLWRSLPVGTAIFYRTQYFGMRLPSDAERDRKLLEMPRQRKTKGD